MGPLRGKPLLRGNARPGHGIYVSGTLGGSRRLRALGLLEPADRAGPRPGAAAWEGLLRAHLRPAPAPGPGALPRGLPGAVAAIDISDGLSSELGHLSRQSGCRMVVEWGKLPYDRELGEAAALSAPPTLPASGGIGFCTEARNTNCSSPAISARPTSHGMAPLARKPASAPSWRARRRAPGGGRLRGRAAVREAWTHW